jgi:uncharacterized protein
MNVIDPSSIPNEKGPAFTPSPQSPPAFHLLAKPTGAICNLDCAYCFFLEKEQLYPGSRFRMGEDMLERYVRQLIEAHRTDSVTFAWQGGEPMLMGLDFFRRAIELANKYRRPSMTFLHTMQTNGTLLDDDWCAFLKEHNFLVGVSIDGPRQLHDVYRVDKGGQPTFDRVMRGIRLLQKHGVEFNILNTVNRVNADHPSDVYRFIRDDIGADWIQFIPVVERVDDDGGRSLYQQGSNVSERSVTPEQFGHFLSAIFDEWVRHDVGRVFVQTFEAATANWLGMESSGMCVFNATCGQGLALEHNGDLYACDHFVEPDYLLGNIADTHMGDLVTSPQQLKFGQDKRGALPGYCLECDVRFACQGECPKNRFFETSDGEPGLNYLCAGYKNFFHHIAYPMQVITGLLRRGRPADEVILLLDQEEAKWRALFDRTGRNDPCPCGSGRKFKQCHARQDAVMPARPVPVP